MRGWRFSQCIERSKKHGVLYREMSESRLFWMTDCSQLCFGRLRLDFLPERSGAVAMTGLQPIRIEILAAAADAGDGLAWPPPADVRRTVESLLRYGHLERVTMFDRATRLYITDAGLMALRAADQAAND